MMVFRWEHVSNGIGPLCGMNPLRGYIPIDCIFGYHRTPIESKIFRNYIRDNIVGITPTFIDTESYDMYTNFFFAWDCIDKFSDNLLPGAEKHLKDNDFIPVIYQVKEKFVVLEDGQVFFDKTAATRIGVL